MHREQLVQGLQWLGWGIILGLCVMVALLWLRLDQQVGQNKADIEVLKAYADAQDTNLRETASAAQARLENRWRHHLMPLLRQHHRLLESIPEVREPIPPLPDWLKE